MSGKSPLQKKFSLQERALHKLAKICWGDFVVSEINDWNLFITLESETEVLVAHRETVVNNLSQVLNSLPNIYFSDLPKQLRVKLINAIICLQQGYSEALIWKKKCHYDFPFTILYPVTANKYQVDYFIDPMGQFNDLAWAKHFVADENQFVDCRFVLACLYCFEETITEYWHIMKTMEPCKDNLGFIKSVYGDLVGLWAYRLENKFDELVEENNSYADGFYACGLREAIFRGHENVARFFWARFTDREREYFLQKPEFELLSDAAKHNHAGLVNFMYSLLPPEQKNNLVSWSIKNNREIAWIWSCLLHSPFYETTLKDILTFPFPIPSIIYEYLLTLLTYKMKELRIPISKTIFEALWNHLTQNQRKEVFELNSEIIMNLANLKAQDLLKMNIQPLTHSEKENMLFNDWQYAGESTLDEFSKVGDYNALLHYLLLFLIDCNPITQKESLRDDATDFIDRFIKGEFFVSWTRNLLTEPEEKEVNKVIECLQVSLQVLQQLLDWIEDMDYGRTKTKEMKTYSLHRQGYF